MDSSRCSAPSNSKSLHSVQPGKRTPSSTPSSCPVCEPAIGPEEPMTDVVTYEARERKAYLTLNRPERLNAITGEVAGALHAAVERANEDPEVHVVILQGAGRAFSAGYDL